MTRKGFPYFTTYSDKILIHIKFQNNLFFFRKKKIIIRNQPSTQIGPGELEYYANKMSPQSRKAFSSPVHQYIFLATRGQRWSSTTGASRHSSHSDLLVTYGQPPAWLPKVITGGPCVYCFLKRNEETNGKGE